MTKEAAMKKPENWKRVWADTVDYLVPLLRLSESQVADDLVSV